MVHSSGSLSAGGGGGLGCKNLLLRRAIKASKTSEKINSLVAFKFNNPHPFDVSVYYISIYTVYVCLLLHLIIYYMYFVHCAY